MRRITGALREHVFQPTCSAAGASSTGEEVVREGSGGDKGDRGASGNSGKRCWIEPFMVDIRYDTSTDEVRKS